VKNQSITPRSISRAIRNNSKKRPKDHPKHKPPYGDFFKFEHFTPHDLRRTAATKMASLRITEHDVSKVLNQTIQTVTNKHYNHYSYDKEKQQALNKWSRKLQSIISGESPGKIVELKNR
jgi:integrase